MLELPNKKYQIIYADPPWLYEFSSTDSRKIENQYDTMSIDDIKNISIHTDDNCALFLWATSPKLVEALEVMKSWGFEYKTHMIWDKSIIGMGYWFRGQHELLLIGTRGNISPPAESKRISSVFVRRRTKHSRKPDEIRKIIEEWYPNKTKIELFARQRFEGWDAWGNETPNEVQMKLGGKIC